MWKGRKSVAADTLPADGQVSSAKCTKLTKKADLVPSTTTRRRRTGKLQAGLRSMKTKQRAASSCPGIDVKPTRLLHPAGCWIKVFGFTREVGNEVMRKFSQFGNITDYKIPTNGGNWLYLCYAHRDDAKRATTLNEHLITPTIMIGVRIHRMRRRNGSFPKNRRVYKQTAFSQNMTTTLQLSNANGKEEEEVHDALNCETSLDGKHEMEEELSNQDDAFPSGEGVDDMAYSHCQGVQLLPEAAGFVTNSKNDANDIHIGITDNNNVEEEIESDDDYTHDFVYQTVYTCDEKAVNEAFTFDVIPSVKLENVAGDSQGRSDTMEVKIESEAEENEEEEEVVHWRLQNRLSEVALVKEEVDHSSDNEICNDNLLSSKMDPGISGMCNVFSGRNRQTSNVCRKTLRNCSTKKKNLSGAASKGREKMADSTLYKSNTFQPKVRLHRMIESSQISSAHLGKVDEEGDGGMRKPKTLLSIKGTETDKQQDATTIGSEKHVEEVFRYKDCKVVRIPTASVLRLVQPPAQENDSRPA